MHRPGARQDSEHATALILRDICHVERVFDLLSVQRGYNNQTYIATIEPPAAPISCNSSATPGTPLPRIPAGTRKLVVRFSRPPPGQERRKTENEVAVLRLIEQSAPDLPVPRVYAWDNDASNPYGSEYMVESFLPGVCLADCLDTIGPDAESKIFLNDMARTFARLKSIPIPGNRFGGFGLDLVTGAVIVKESPLGYGGPTDTLRDHYVHYLQSQCQKARMNTILRGYEDFPELSSRLSIENFRLIVDHVVQDCDMTPTLVHGDFSSQNILINMDTKRISGVVDFEMAYAGPPIEEFCEGFSGFGDYASLGVRNPISRQELLASLEPLRSHAGSVLSTHPDAPFFSEHTRYFVSQLEMHGTFVPSDLDNSSKYSALYWLGQDLCSWTFTQDMPDSFWKQKSKESRVAEAADAVSWLMDLLMEGSSHT